MREEGRRGWEKEDEGRGEERMEREDEGGV